LSASFTEVDLFDAGSGGFLRTMTPAIGEKTDTVHFSGIACSPNGKRIALGVGRGGRSVAVLDAKTGDVLHRYQTDVSPETSRSATMQSLAFSPNGKRLVACVEGRVNVWDLATGERIFVRGPKEDYQQFYSFARLSHDGRRLLLQSRSRVQLWDLKTGKMLGEHGAVDYAGFRKDGSVIAVNLGAVSAYDRVHAARDAPPKLIRLVKLGDWKPESKTALAGEAELAAFVCNHTVLVLNLKTDRVENELPLAAEYTLDGLQFSPDGRVLYVGSHRTLNLQTR
jgi:WD40 repeat protein